MFDFNSMLNYGKTQPLPSSSLDLGKVATVQQTPNASNGIMDTLNGWSDSKGFFGKNSMFGGVDKSGNATQGWFGGVTGAVGTLADSWLAMQQLGLAQEQFDFQKGAFNKQYENQRTLTNASLEDRQRARLGANPNGYQSVGDYMKANGV